MLKNVLIDQFLVKDECREPKKQYLYLRLESDNSINSGTTSQEHRYPKTPAKEEYFLDVSGFLAVGVMDRPDDIFHNWLKNYKHWNPEIGHRDVFKDKTIPEFFEAFIEFYEDHQHIKRDKTPIHLREYQKLGEDSLSEFYESEDENILLEALTGYGKTCTLYSFLIKNKVPETAIITNRKLISTAFIDTFRNFHLQDYGLCLITPNAPPLGDIKTAKQIIYLVPNKKNKLLKKVSSTALFVIDEAHLGGNTEKMKIFLKNRRVIFITGTGNKLLGEVDSTYYFGITDIVKAIKKSYIAKSDFPIPNFSLSSNKDFRCLDFSRLNKYPLEILEPLINDILDKNKSKNAIIKLSGHCKNGCDFANTLMTLHKEIKVYCSTDGKNSHSFSNGKKEKDGSAAIHQFDSDCEKEKDITHILVTVHQGKESYSYYDLYNVFFLCDTTSLETFFQLLGRLMRKKNHTLSTEATFFMYSDFPDFCVTLEEQFQYECIKKGVPFNQDDFDDFVRVFNVTVDGKPYFLSGQTVIENFDLHHSACRNLTKTDWDLLGDIFGDEGKTHSRSGGKTKVHGKSGSIPHSGSSTEEEKARKKNILKVKQKYNLFANNLPFYFKFLEYYKEHLEKINDSRFNLMIKDFKYPKNREDLKNLPLWDFQSIVFNIDKNKIIELFTKLSDVAIELLLKKCISKKNTELSELSHIYVNSNKKISERTGFDPSIVNRKFRRSLKNKKLLIMRTGIKFLLSIKNTKYKQLMYYTDVTAERFICDYYGIEYKLVNKDWGNTISSIGEKMKFDIAIINPPWNLKSDLHCNITEKCLQICEYVMSLMPDNFMETNSNKRHDRYRETLGKSIISYTKKEVAKLFGIGYDKAALFEFVRGKGTLDYDIGMGFSDSLIEEHSSLIKARDSLIENLNNIKEWVSHKTIKDLLVTFDNRDKVYINVGTFFGKLHGNPAIVTPTDSWHPADNSWDKGLYNYSDNEAKNIIDSWDHLEIIKNLNLALMAGNNVGRNALSNLRMMNDYSTQITENTYIEEMGIQDLVCNINSLAKRAAEFRNKQK